VQVLVKQVEELSGGSITQTALKRGLSIGVAVAVAISMVRVLTGISMYWIIVPGYVIALAMTFFVPKIFVGIAFDVGGVAPGPMTACFLLPLAIGACEGVGGNVMMNAFGSVSMVALTPLIAIQIMGLVYGMKLKQAELVDEALGAEADEALIILAEEEEPAPKPRQPKDMALSRLRQAAAVLYEELHSIIDDDGIVLFDDDTGMISDILDQGQNTAAGEERIPYE